MKTIAIALAVAFAVPARSASSFSDFRLQTSDLQGATEVSLARTWATDADVEKIAAIKTLKRVDLSMTYVSDLGIEKLKALNQLEDLNLYAAEFITDAAVAFLRGHRQLKTLNLRGTDGDRGAFSPLIIAAGGFGARSAKDGPSCLAFPTNTECAPIEMIEASAPVLFSEKQLITDSGGAGLFRGGLGQRVAVEILADHAEAFVRAQRLRRPARGILGGGPGGPAAILVNGKAVYSPLRKIQLRRGDTIAIHSPGGGGYGPPMTRDHDLVRADVRDGYVSIEKASALYGAQPERGAVGEGSS